MCSCGSAQEGNQMCEATRSARMIEQAKGVNARTAKARALTQVNPIRPRYTNMQVAILPKVLKPVIGGEETGTSNRRTCRGDWGERAPKERSDRWEIRRDVQEETNGQRRQGNHNLPNGHGRKSDRLIRAMKRGNARRAKGPNVSRVSIEVEEVRLSPSGSRTGHGLRFYQLGTAASQPRCRHGGWAARSSTEDIPA